MAIAIGILTAIMRSAVRFLLSSRLLVLLIFLISDLNILHERGGVFFPENC